MDIVIRICVLYYAGALLCILFGALPDASDGRVPAAQTGRTAVTPTHRARKHTLSINARVPRARHSSQCDVTEVC